MHRPLLRVALCAALLPAARAAASPCPDDGTLELGAGCYRLTVGAALRATAPITLVCAPGAPLEVTPIACPTPALAPLPTAPFYLPIAAVHPGQVRISTANAEDKYRAAITRGDAVPDGHRITRRYDDGRSILSLAQPLPVIAGPVGYVLVDGHHDAVASVWLGATTVPVRIEADLRALSVDDFWTTAEARGYVYPHAIGGAYQLPPPAFDALVDDPGRYFAAITARKCQDTTQPAAASIGAERPLWVKVGRDLPFIEFRISDALAGALTYGSGPPTDDQLAVARDRLRARPIAGLRLVDPPAAVGDLPDLCATAPLRAP